MKPLRCHLTYIGFSIISATGSHDDRQRVSMTGFVKHGKATVTMQTLAEWLDPNDASPVSVSTNGQAYYSRLVKTGLDWIRQSIDSGKPGVMEANGQRVFSSRVAAAIRAAGKYFSRCA